MATKHTGTLTFGRCRDASDCPRCAELNAGEAEVPGAAVGVARGVARMPFGSRISRGMIAGRRVAPWCAPSVSGEAGAMRVLTTRIAWHSLSL